MEKTGFLLFLTVEGMDYDGRKCGGDVAFYGVFFAVTVTRDSLGEQTAWRYSISSNLSDMLLDKSLPVCLYCSAH